MILKVQRPLAGDMSKALVYNQMRTVETFVPAVDVAHLFLTGEKKVYVEGRIADGMLLVEETLPEQPW